jgi:hypothetical protein
MTSKPRWSRVSARQKISIEGTAVHAACRSGEGDGQVTNGIVFDQRLSALERRADRLI